MDQMPKKLNSNKADPCSVGYRVAGHVGPFCCNCGGESELPAHVPESFQNNLPLFVTRRYHPVKHTLIELVSGRGYECCEKIYGIEGTRYTDINSVQKAIQESTATYSAV